MAKLFSWAAFKACVLGKDDYLPWSGEGCLAQTRNSS